MMKRNIILLVLVLVLAMVVLAAPVTAGLTVDPADPAFLKITEMDGSVSYNFTITDALIAQDGTIDIDVSLLDQFVADGFSVMTNDNVVVSDTAATADWTYNIDTSILTLTSTNGDTAEGETVNVTFTGANGNPWIYDTQGAVDPFPLTATRIDTAETATFNFAIETVPGHLTVEDGEKITATDGITWANFTITDAPIIKDCTITIPVTQLNQYAASGTFTTANVVVEDSVADPTVWTGTVAGNTLTLTSTGGRTPVGNWVNVTFTGATNPWKPNTGGTKTVVLTGTRTDSAETGTFNFVIETVPPAGYDVAANFTASPTSDIAPLTVAFTDASTGNPDMWNWSFGDGAWFNTTNPATKNPAHTYVNVGKYTVNLTAKNVYGPNTKSRDKYINVLNGTVVTSSTSITGLTTAIVGGQQTVTVDASVLPAALIPNNSVLEIKPPADRGWKNITIYAMPGVFVQAGSTITGTVTGVHLVSAEIAPSAPTFSLTVGPDSSFNYSINLATYPCSATLTTKIWEGVIDEYDNKVRQIAQSQVPNASVIGTAYTAKVTKTNFPATTAVIINMSVDTNWDDTLVGGPGNLHIVRISDDGSEGQVLPTQFSYHDAGENLDYYGAESSRGLSTFGLYSLDKANNVYQLIALTVAQAASSPPSEQPPSDTEGGTGSTQGTGAGQGTGTAAVGKTGEPEAAGLISEPVSVDLSVNEQGMVTEAAELLSPDGIATVSIGQGVVAVDQAGAPVSSITIDNMPITDLPDVPESGTMSFAGVAYELQPDGAQFSPAISISFAVPAGQVGQDLTVRTYDHATDTWVDLPTTFDPVTGTVTAEVSHFCCFALFTKFVTPAAPTIAPTPVLTPLIPTTLAPPSPTIATTFLGIVLTVVNLLVTNPVLIAGIVILAVGIVLMVWKQRRDRLNPGP